MSAMAKVEEDETDAMEGDKIILFIVEMLLRGARLIQFGV